MSRAKSMPDDVKKSCLALVQGYSRRLRNADNALERQRVQAIEYAARNVGQDLSENDREALLQAIIKSCINGRKYPFEKLHVDIMERTCFYNRRTKFLSDIAEYMDLL